MMNVSDAPSLARGFPQVEGDVDKIGVKFFLMIFERHPKVSV